MLSKSPLAPKPDLKPLTDAQAEISRLTQRVAELETESRPLGDAEFVKAQVAIILNERNELGIQARERDAELLAEQKANSQMRQRVAELEAANDELHTSQFGMKVADLKDQLIIAMKEGNDLQFRLTAVMDAAERERAKLFLALDSADARAATAKAELAHLRELIEGALTNNGHEDADFVLSNIKHVLDTPDDFSLCEGCSGPLHVSDAECPACGHYAPCEVGPVADGPEVESRLMKP